jgi:hypothetical protein
MRIYLKVMSWVIIVLMVLGVFSSIEDGSLDFYTFLAFCLIASQSIIALQYIARVDSSVCSDSKDCKKINCCKK